MKKKLTSLLLLPILILSLCLPVHAADSGMLAVKMNHILDLVERFALEYDPAVINDDLRADLTRLINEDPTRFDILMNEVLSGLDAYSMYLPAETYDAAFGTPEGYAGIGITMELVDGQAHVKAIDPNGPAAATGMQPGDILISANDRPLPYNDLDGIASMIRGEAGTTVRVGVHRGTLDMTFTITRAAIETPTLTGRQLEEGIYYMDLERFSGNELEDEFRYYMLELTRLQSKVLILDLRGNPGGDLSIVTDMLNRLIPDDDIPYFALEGRADTALSVDETYTSTGRGPRLNKILLLTDSGSASASEIMTGSLCDLGYALSIGETTYGKARGQQHLIYEDGSAAVITIARLVLPSGVDYEGIGLCPDYAVENREGRHPAAFCRKLDFKYLGQGDRSWKVDLLQDALKAIGYLPADCAEDFFGPVTLDALNRFRADCGLGYKTYFNAESQIRINACLEALSQQTVPVDTQLNKALELARTYARQPLQYTADKYGQFENLQ